MPKRPRLQTGHYPAIPYEDLPDFFQELRSRPALAARALELTILCATRTNETLGARWKEFDLANRVWTVPAERMKMKVEHRIPLSDAAFEILAAQLGQSKGRPDDFVFPGQKRGQPRSQMAMTMVLRRMKMGHITVHGMRSAFRDYMGDMTDHAEAVVELALAHQVGDTTVRAYRRKRAFEKRRSVMADWARYVLSAGIVAANSDETVELAA
jgi:integrase